MWTLNTSWWWPSSHIVTSGSVLAPLLGRRSRLYPSRERRINLPSRPSTVGSPSCIPLKARSAWSNGRWERRRVNPCSHQGYNYDVPLDEVYHVLVKTSCRRPRVNLTFAWMRSGHRSHHHSADRTDVAGIGAVDDRIADIRRSLLARQPAFIFYFFSFFGWQTNLRIWYLAGERTVIFSLFFFFRLI